MLIQRFLTALVLVPLSVAAVLLTSSVQFCFFISAVVLVAAWEWAVLLNAPLWGRLLYALGLGAAMFVMYLHPLLWRPLCFAAVLFWLLALYWVLQYPKSKSVWYRPVVVWVLGLCVLLPSWVSLMVLRHDMTHSYWVLYAMSTVWVADTAAYFLGKAFGRRKLAPVVSPGKSVAGVVGGVVTVIALSVLLSIAIDLEPIVALWLTVASGAAALFSVLGDLFESMVKRSVGVKDSGQWLPGHGGILDRVDALTSAIPFFTVIYVWFLSGRL